MTPRQIELVQSTWRSMLPIRDTFAELFYGKLFSLDAGLQRLFTGDMREQGRNLAAMISIVVRSLERPENVRQSVLTSCSGHFDASFRLLVALNST